MTIVELADWGLTGASRLALMRVTMAEPALALRIVEVRDKIRAPATVPPRPGRPLALANGVDVVATLASGGFNRLGGSFATFQKAPSSGEVDIDDSADEPSARFVYQRAAAGFTGFWVHLFDDRAARRERLYTDASAAKFLLFEIRGASGGEELTLQVADGRWEARGDSTAIGDVASFLPGKRVATRWQRAVVPMERLRGLDKKHLASVVFVASPGSGTIHIRNIAFAKRADAELPAATRATRPERRMRVAMWVWKATEVAGDRGEVAALVEFCRGRGVTDAFLQVPAPASASGLREASDLSVLEPVVAALVAAGVRVEALDGAPSLALAKNHPINRATIAAVIDYNRQRDAGARFAGVRLDNEPYLLPGFRGPRQASIARQYLDALADSARLARSAGLTMGADIPFWFDTYNAHDELGAGLDGRPLSELVLERVDNISIMDYRTRTYGADGVLAHAAGEIEHATRVGKHVFIALETEDLPDERHETYGREVLAGEPVLVARPVATGRVEVRRFDAAERDAAAAWATEREGSQMLGRTASSRLDASKLSFARASVAELDTVIEQTWRHLSSSPSVIGIAIHSYEAYRRWQARQSTPSAAREPGGG